MEIDWQKHAQHLLTLLNGFVAIVQRQIKEINEKNEHIARLEQEKVDAYNRGYDDGWEHGHYES
jgi:hypothetical protein